MAENEPADVLDVARERDEDAKVEDVIDVVLSKYPPEEPCEVELRLPMASPTEPDVPGRTDSIGKGEGDSRPAFKFSRDKREKIAISVSFLGRMTVSRKVKSVILRTSSSPSIGMFLFSGDLVFISSGSSTPQKSAAWEDVIIPFPLNSRSSGRKTAWRNGRMVVNTTNHISTR